MRGETLVEREDEAAVDLGKANNYAHRLVRGKWRDR